MSWKGNSQVNGYLYSPEYLKVEPVDEEKMEVIETYCSVFGCGRRLSLVETLLGNRCIEHGQIKKLKWSN